jgi:hypothetical protein
VCQFILEVQPARQLAASTFQQFFQAITYCLSTLPSRAATVPCYSVAVNFTIMVAQTGVSPHNCRRKFGTRGQAAPYQQRLEAAQPSRCRCENCDAKPTGLGCHEENGKTGRQATQGLTVIERYGRAGGKAGQACMDGAGGRQGAATSVQRSRRWASAASFWGRRAGTLSTGVKTDLAKIGSSRGTAGPRACWGPRGGSWGLARKSGSKKMIGGWRPVWVGLGGRNVVHTIN